MAGEQKGVPWWVVGMIAVVVAFAFLGSRALWEPTETRYAECAREMLVSHDYLVPTLHHELHVAKPPLSYWGIVAGMRLVGWSPWGARLFLAPVFILTVLCVALLGERLWDDLQGRWAGIIYATMLVPVAAAGVLSADTLLALFETAALCCFWMGWRAGRPEGEGGGGVRHSAAWIAVAWAFFGLGFATKGPPALLPLLALIGFVVIVAPGQGAPRRCLLSPVGIVLFAVLGLGWYALIAAIVPGSVGFFLRDEMFRRVFASAHARNPEFWHVFRLYLPALSVGALPWAWYLPGLVRRGFRRRSWSTLRQRPAALLLLLWIMLPLAVFSISKSKLVLYVLPLFVPLALALTRVFLDRRLARSAARREGAWISHQGVAALFVLVASLVTFRFAASRVDAPRDSRVLAAFLARVLDEAGDELISVDRLIHGPDLLLGVRTENVTIDHGQSIDRAAYPDPTGELEELAWSTHRHVFLVGRLRLHWLEQQLAARGARCAWLKGPTRYYVARCPPRSETPPPYRLAVVLDHRENPLGRFELAQDLRRLDGRRRLDAVAVLRWPAAQPSVLSRLLRPDFIDELWPLRERGVRVVVLDDAAGVSEDTALAADQASAVLSIEAVDMRCATIRLVSGSHRLDLWQEPGEDALTMRVESAVRTKVPAGEIVLIEASPEGLELLRGEDFCPPPLSHDKDVNSSVIARMDRKSLPPRFSR